ncbi:hypothetical protein K8I61_18660 [bacterium]|nr:hypothetical protein [bacterium]
MTPSSITPARIGRALAAVLFAIVCVIAFVATESRADEASTTAPATPAEPEYSAEIEHLAQEAKGRLLKTNGGRIALAAIEKAGGLANWYAGGAIEFSYEYRVREDKPPYASTQTHDIRSSRMHQQVHGPVEGRTAWTGKRAWTTLEPGEFPVRFWATKPYHFTAMPFAAAAPNAYLSLKPDDDGTSLGFEPSHAVEVWFDQGGNSTPDDWYRLYLTQKDLRLVGMTYVLTYRKYLPGDPETHSSEHLVVFEDFESRGGILLSRTHTVHELTDERKRADVRAKGTVSELAFPATFDDALLKRPTGAMKRRSLDALRPDDREWDPNFLLQLTIWLSYFGATR